MMNKIKFIAVVAVALMGITANAQSEPDKGTHLTVAVTAGSNSALGVSAMPGAQAVYSTEVTSLNWMNKGLSFGLEAGLNLGLNWRIVLGGGFNMTAVPGSPAVIGTADPSWSLDDNWGEVPTYSSVPTQQSMSYLAYTGADYRFKIEALPALRPYAGIRVMGSYSSDSKLSDDEYAMGRSIAESYALKGALVGGADFYVANGLFVGIAFDLFNYTYGMTAYKPQEGLGSLKAAVHNFGGFACPTIKVGVQF